MVLVRYIARAVIRIGGLLPIVFMFISRSHNCSRLIRARAQRACVLDLHFCHPDANGLSSFSGPSAFYIPTSKP